MSRRSASFPHPVLGSGEDVAGALTCDLPSVDTNGPTTVVDIAGLLCSNGSISRMIEAGDAEFAIRLDCGSTLFRRTYTTRAAATTLSLQSGQLQGNVELRVSVQTTKAVAGYHPEGLHPDYGEAVFPLQSGAIIAMAPLFSFELEDEFDPLDATGSSLFRVRQMDSVDDPVRFDFGAPSRIFIWLSKNEFTKYSQIQGNFPGIIHVGLVFPCLIKAIERVRASSEAESEWERKLRELLDRSGIGGDVPPESAAATLLRRPFWRAATQAIARLSNDDNRDG